ncbi:MAG: NADH-quinone oxidoreductase subunit D [Anaerolineales bacterium]
MGQIASPQDKDGQTLRTDQMVVNLGPQHPSTHGVFRMVITLEGETIVDLQPVMGYLHRNHEKIGERNTYIMNMPYTDRLDYICSMHNNFGYALAVEKLMGIRPPERAEYIRVIMAELTRVVSHLWSIGFLLNDLGAYFTPALYAINERELILDVFEATAGSRMMCNYFRFGGLARDLPPGALEKVKELVFERLPRSVDELDLYLTGNEIIRARCIGVGVLPPDKAVAFSAAGPVLRASGVAYDLRRADPYSIYDRLDFDVVTRPNGDVYDRYLVRVDEIRQSLRILRQVLRDLPEGEIQTGKPQYQVRVPAGEAYGRVENPKGELGFYVVSNGKPNPWRYHIRAPSFINLTVLAEMCRGHKVADVVAILGSIDIVLGETDR